MKLKKTHRRGIGVAVLSLLGMLLTACSSGATVAQPDLSLVGESVSTDFSPVNNGFYFANFAAAQYRETFAKADLLAMVGTNSKVCVGGKSTPCILTGGAEKVIKTVNDSRRWGNCEGMIVIAAARYNIKAVPTTSALPADTITIKAIIRAFATMFLPEVQAESRTWSAETLADNVAVLAASIKTGKLEYGLGLYTKGGGHEVLPYAISYPKKDLARISVYDSNWPQKERFVDVNLKTQKWKFAFSGANPLDDPNAWTGGQSDLALNSNQSRIDGLTKRLGAHVKPTGPLWQTSN
jgi:hypothetical protein